MSRSHPPILITGLAPSRPPKSWPQRALQAVGLWKSRQRLARLDDAALRDIGLTRHEAMQEAEKPLWDVPPSWLR